MAKKKGAQRVLPAKRLGSQKSRIEFKNGAAQNEG